MGYVGLTNVDPLQPFTPGKVNWCIATEVSNAANTGDQTSKPALRQVNDKAGSESGEGEHESAETIEDTSPKDEDHNQEAETTKDQNLTAGMIESQSTVDETKSDTPIHEDNVADKTEEATSQPKTILHPSPEGSPEYIIVDATSGHEDVETPLEMEKGQITHAPPAPGISATATPQVADGNAPEDADEQLSASKESRTSKSDAGDSQTDVDDDDGGEDEGAGSEPTQVETATSIHIIFTN